MDVFISNEACPAKVNVRGGWEGLSGICTVTGSKKSERAHTLPRNTSHNNNTSNVRLHRLTAPSPHQFILLSLKIGGEIVLGITCRLCVIAGCSLPPGAPLMGKENSSGSWKPLSESSA